MKLANMMIISLYLLLIVSAQFAAAQDLSASVILEKTDAVGKAPKDQHSLATMILTDKDGDQKERKTEIYEKGGDMRLMRFLSPADQKGISFLSLPDDKMYLYLPAFRKIRTIASHVKNENFAGTDFSYDDISSFGYAEDHDPILLETTDEYYVLELTPKPESEKDYGKLKIWVRKDNFFTVKTEYYDKGGNLWKILERRNIEKKGEYWIAMEIEMKDLKKSHSTKSITEMLELDTGLSDEIFTQRNLKKVE